MTPHICALPQIEFVVDETGDIWKLSKGKDGDPDFMVADFAVSAQDHHDALILLSVTVSTLSRMMGFILAQEADPFLDGKVLNGTIAVPKSCFKAFRSAT